MTTEQNEITESFHRFLCDHDFPCVAARDAAVKGLIKIFVADHLGCPHQDKNILEFIYGFTDDYRKAEKGFHSVAIIFKEPHDITEELFDNLMWQRLQALRGIDSKNYNYDSRVSDDISSPYFSFSLMEEAFFVLALQPNSSRASRRFKYPALIFNPHQQFEEMKITSGYEKMKNIVRKRDLAFSGSVNPMLKDFGELSEVFQYSGRAYDANWKCPLKNAEQK